MCKKIKSNEIIGLSQLAIDAEKQLFNYTAANSRKEIATIKWETEEVVEQMEVFARTQIRANQLNAVVKQPIVERALITAYKKTVWQNDNVGWDELSDLLHDALCELKGDDWMHKFTHDEAV